MELMAAIAGLSALQESCTVSLTTDSQYVRQGITQWIQNWKRRGWLTADKKPVKNVDLWQQLDLQVQRHQVTWHWVKGHSGHDENERCDVLAREAASQSPQLEDTGYRPEAKVHILAIPGTIIGLRRQARCGSKVNGTVRFRAAST